MSLSDLPNELSDRGIWWQVVGFAIAGCASVAILQIWDGSNCWAYRSFEIAVKDLYWMFVLPLAGLIEGVRKLFEKASEIRAVQREKMVRRAIEKGLEQGREQGLEQGREQGLEQGREQGLEQGRKQALSQLRALLRDAPQDPTTGAITITQEAAADLLGEPPNDDA